MKRSTTRFLIFFWLFWTFFLLGMQLLSRFTPDKSPQEATGDISAGWKKNLPSPLQTRTTRGMSSPGESSTTGDVVQSEKVGDTLKLFPGPWENRTGWEEYCRFSNTGSGRLWPKRGEDEDRILNQLHLTQTDAKSNKLKRILLHSGLDPGMDPGQSRFVDHRCPVDQCILTGDLDEAETADAVLFRDFVSDPGFRRPRNQIWIVYLLESAANRYSLEALANKINWTATYRRDSTLVTPYERFTFFSNYTGLPGKAPRDFTAGKRKKVAWIVSNCNTANGRRNYVKELSKYIDVDIFGRCGSQMCPRRTRECQQTLRDYKFYLAFENSNCVDYITEKMFWNAFGQNLSDANDVVPVVMGARPEDYARLAPPESFIHVDDFESPKSLAEYLNKVDQDDDLYNSYFRWKGTGDYINTKFWCRLCAMIHETHRTKHHVVINSFHDWWNGDGVCVTPPSITSWASWRNATPKYNYDGNYFTSWVGK